MQFLWPSAFFLFAAVPLLIGVHAWMQRRRRRYAVRFSSLSLVRQAIPAQSRVRRYIPPALFLLAFSALVLGLARPVAVTMVPSGRATVVLTMDVSGSMRQRDISPSRLSAAKRAAMTFIERQQVNNQIGIVAFAGYAQLVQPPTNETRELEQAVQSLTTARGTAIGSGIMTALDTIAEYNHQVASTSEMVPNTGPSSPGSAAPVPDIIVVLTDGVNTRGPEPLDAAQLAAERGVRVYTIGFGTRMNNAEQESDMFGGWGFNRGIDEETLKQIAAMTGGEYFTASSAGELQNVFESLPTYLNTREETTEISVIFAAVGALLIVFAVLLAQFWSPIP